MSIRGNQLLISTAGLALAVVVAKLIVELFGWEFINLSPLFSSIIAGGIFILSILLSGVIADGLLLTAFVSYIFIFLIRLLHVAETPFRERGSSKDDVNLFLLRDLQKRIDGKP